MHFTDQGRAEEWLVRRKKKVGSINLVEAKLFTKGSPKVPTTSPEKAEG
jgi:hypothetical protein